MQEHYLIVGIVAVILIVLVSLFIVVLNLKRTVVVEQNTFPLSTEEEKAQKLAIEALVEIAAKRTSSKNDLSAAILKVAQECPFPKKEKGIMPKRAKVYLNFILLIASHKNTDAKMIAFMNEELKKVNPEYKQEIDIYENEGIHQRGNRV